MSWATALDRLAALWWRELAELSWQIGLLVILVLGISGLCRRAAPQARYLMWLLVVVRLLVPMGLASPLGLVTGGDHPESPGPAPAWPVDVDLGAAAPVPAMAMPPGETVVALAPLSKLPRTAFLVWLGGVTLLASAWGLRRRRTRRRLAGLPTAAGRLAEVSERLGRELGLRRPVEIRVDGERSSSRRLQAPAVFGGWRPVVVLSREMAESWSTAELEPVLLHELIHVRRGDTWVNAIQGLLQVVYFFHPMVWLANRRIAVERELACDDAVVAHYRGRPEAYLYSLFKIAATHRAALPDPTALAMARRFSGIGRRMARLAALRGVSAAPRRTALSALVLCSAGLIAASVAARRPELAGPAGGAEARPSAAARAAITTVDVGPPPTLEGLLRLIRGEEPPRVALRWIAGHPRSSYTAEASAFLELHRGTAIVRRARDLWLAQVEAHGDEPEILGNAAIFLMPFTPELAEALLRRAQALAPREAEWPRLLAELYSRLRQPRRALAAQELALRLAGTAREKARLLTFLPELALAAGELDQAHRHARELLHDAAEQADPWVASNMRHRAHVALGRLAWRAGSMAAAADHLLAAADVAPSPQLRTFGPRMTLAKELLELGERDVVLEYLAACARFWERGRERLQSWAETVTKGEIPDFADRGGC